MPKLILFAFCLFKCLITVAHPTMAEPRLIYEAHYEGKVSGLKVRMARRLFDLGDNRFLLKAEAKNFLGSINESEEFIWSDSSMIQPLRYRYRQRIFGVKKTREIDFDWQQRKARSLNKKEELTLLLDEDVLGPMTSQLMLQLDLLKGVSSLNYRVLSRNRLREYVFNKGPLSSFALKNRPETKLLALTRSNEGGSRKTKLLFDPEDHFNLVLIEHTKGDDSNTLVMTSAKYFPPLMKTPFSILQSKFLSPIQNSTDSLVSSSTTAD